MVTKQTISTEVTPEALAIGNALKKILVLAHESTKDGFQPAQDITTVVMGSFAEISKAISNIGTLNEEMKTELGAAIRGIIVPVTEGAESFLK